MYTCTLQISRCCNGRPEAGDVSHGVQSDYGVSIITTLWKIMNLYTEINSGLSHRLFKV